MSQGITSFVFVAVRFLVNNLLAMIFRSTTGQDALSCSPGFSKFFRIVEKLVGSFIKKHPS